MRQSWTKEWQPNEGPRMNRFAALLEALTFQPSRNGKIRLLTKYLGDTPDPDRGYALAALTGGLSFKHAKPALLRQLVHERVDPVLYDLSYDYVGDMAETLSLIWPPRAGANQVPDLEEVVTRLNTLGKSEVPHQLARWLDALDPSGRWALIKLMTGGLRIGVSARLAKTAVAQLGGIELSEIEELWHGLTPPYENLFAWIEGRAAKPENAAEAPFHPVMLAQPIEESDFEKLDPNDYRAEWKWDGIRVQAVSEGTTKRLYSRTGDDISGAFPDIIDFMPFEGAIDGELLIVREGITAPFSDLQKRLNRKTVSAKLLKDAPAAIRAYDVLKWEGEDLRPLPFDERRRRLEDRLAPQAGAPFDLSPLVTFETWNELADLRVNPPLSTVEGLMLKHKDSPYTPGRSKGPWFKWKRDPFLIDAVLMYAQRGHGKRSSFYSDYTFGVWTSGEDGPLLVPVGKSYFGFTDEELKEIDKFVRNNTINRFGPVCEVTHTQDTGLVFEVAFEGLNRSTRHKSGLAMRFPRIHRLRWDKPPGEADELGTLERMMSDTGT